MRILKLLGSRAFVLMHDLLGVPLAIFAALFILGNLQISTGWWSVEVAEFIAVALLTHAVSYIVVGSYRGIWRYAALPDLYRLMVAVSMGAVGAGIIWALLRHDVVSVPRAMFVLYPGVLLGILTVSRVAFRAYNDRVSQSESPHLGRALIVGAGRAGDLLVRDMIRTGTFDPVGFLDDEPAKYGHEVQGVRVLGRIDDLPRLLGKHIADVVLIAMPSAPKATMDRVVQMCLAASVDCRTLPSMIELADGRVEVSKLRPVTVEDLLGRDPVRLDEPAIAAFIKGKRVLVTGGGGSIGSELCRQVAQHGAERLLVLEQGEFNLYQIEMEMRARFPQLKLESRLGDVRDATYIERVFGAFKPQVVFHAAAYKHVPLVEDNVLEGVANNVLGTRVVADAAARSGVERFVLVSTDKTVNPTNVMGTTKRVAEMYCQARARNSRTQFITTRFGNVLASAGSVVPLFERQIRAGGPVTVTHPEVTRYFMTIPEAVGLILQAGAMGKGGDIFVLDMGEPVKIRDLAFKMIQLSGFVPDKDIKVTYTGLRPGEKLYEELFYAKETLVGTGHPKLLLASAAVSELDVLERDLGDLQSLLRQGERDAVISVLRRLVPEYRPGSNSIAASDAEPVPAPSLRVVK
jgi:FlaA1/EpsC-like NDP-sugar epimerase